MLLRDIHSKFLTQYDCKEVCEQSQSQVNVGAELNRLVEASVVRDESSASNADVPVIPSQLKVSSDRRGLRTSNGNGWP